MSSPNGEKPLILYDLMRVTDYRFISKPLHMKKRRQVYFNEIVEVFYTISRVEIIECNIVRNIWWNNTDYASFKFDIDTDTKRFMIEYPGTDYHSARKMVCSADYIYYRDSINE